jgi:SAM-dependent methyltransferase
MAANADSVRSKYKDAQKENNRFSLDRASGLEAHYTKKYISRYISSESSVLEIGCGTGYYGIYLADKCREYLGIDITPEHIELFDAEIKKRGLTNVTAKIGDAVKLDIPDKSFDIVLVLGPMYHLPPAERELAFEESKRICKNGGVIMYAYVSLLGVYMWGCAMSPGNYPSANANECLLVQGVNDIHPDLFHFTTPEDIEQAAISHGLKIVKNVGVDFSFAANLVNNMSDEQYEAWLELNDRMAESAACTGLSNHALLICEKMMCNNGLNA